jgi:hypothetical protein
MHFLTPDEIRRAWFIFPQRSAAGWSFTDCTSKIVIDQLRIGTAISLDAHFAQFGDVVVARTQPPAIGCDPCGINPELSRIRHPRAAARRQLRSARCRATAASGTSHTPIIVRGVTLNDLPAKFVCLRGKEHEFVDSV